MRERAHGTGSIHRRKGGLWVGRYDVPSVDGKRRRPAIYGKDKEGVLMKLDAAVDALGRLLLPVRLPGTRAVHMERARAEGRHTLKQWREVVAAANECHYCQRPFNGIVVKDHMTPVSRGGSDGLDNLAPSCWDCNDAKSNMTESEFRTWAESTGHFRAPRPRRIVGFDGVLRLAVHDPVRQVVRDPNGCPFCEKSPSRNRDGSLRLHRVDGEVCPGSGRIGRKDHARGK